MQDIRPAIAIVGAGSIGVAFAIVFARTGHAVRMFDPDAAARERAVATFADRLADLAAAGLQDAAQMDAVRKRLVLCADLGDAVRDADLVITGEGRIDHQTIFGKTPFGVATVAKRYGKPVIGVAGGLGTNAHVVHEHGIDAIFSVLSSICTLEDALKDAEHNVRSSARNIAAVLAMGQRMG